MTACHVEDSFANTFTNALKLEKEGLASLIQLFNGRLGLKSYKAAAHCVQRLSSEESARHADSLAGVLARQTRLEMHRKREMHDSQGICEAALCSSKTDMQTATLGVMHERWHAQ